jgi:hypothetical protein
MSKFRGAAAADAGAIFLGCGGVGGAERRVEDGEGREGKGAESHGRARAAEVREWICGGRHAARLQSVSPLSSLWRSRFRGLSPASSRGPVVPSTRQRVR